MTLGGIFLFYVTLTYLNEKNLETQLEERAKIINSVCRIYRKELADVALNLCSGKYGAYLIIKRNSNSGEIIFS